MGRGTALAKLLGVTLVAGVLVAGFLYPVLALGGVASNRTVEATAATDAGVFTGALPSTTTVLDDAGNPIAQLYDQDREVVSSDRIALTMKAAIVAIEDRRFFSEAAVDPQGVARAVVNNSAGGSTQGASTLTQQYVKNYDQYVAARTPSERLEASTPTIGRKLREARIALQLDHQLSKDAILTRYLNVVSFGNELYGVASAARSYFGTTPDRLSVEQAALLAGMVQSPTQDDPYRHPEAARARRDTVIAQMRDQGQISPAVAGAALAAPLGVLPQLTHPTEGCLGAGDAGFFCGYVLDYLADAGLPRAVLRSGGYTIRTTLDRAALEAAKGAVDAQVAPTTPHVANVMAVVVPGPGQHRVTALVANRTYGLDARTRQTTYDLPSDPENLGAGSVYKIFTSAAYLAGGGGIDDVLPVPQPKYTSPITPGFTVGNALPAYSSTLSLQDALAQSPNTAFVKLEETTGVAPVVDTAVAMGLRHLDDPMGPDRPSFAQTAKAQNQASFTLGVAPTSALELANVGATLADHGVWCPPNPVVSVTDAQGRPVPLAVEPCSAAVAPGVADALMTALSRDDAPMGTSEPAATAAGWNRPLAAKTGTTNTAQSAVFLGVTPQIAGATIVFDDSTSPDTLCDGTPPVPCRTATLAGGLAPARTWYRAMTDILGDAPVAPLPPVQALYRSGAPTSTVPDLTGRDLPSATAALRRAGLAVTTTPVDSRAPAGTVVAQQPRGETPAGRPVMLFVSTGRVAPPPPPPG